MTTDRFARQRLLEEIGDLGQARLGAADLSLSPRLSPEVRRAARLYGEALGFGVVRVDDNKDSEAFRHERFFRHKSALAIGYGAHLALTRVREVLEFPAVSPLVER